MCAYMEMRGQLEGVLFFHVCPENGTQVLRLCGKYLYLLNHPASPSKEILKSHQAKKNVINFHTLATVSWIPSTIGSWSEKLPAHSRAALLQIEILYQKARREGHHPPHPARPPDTHTSTPVRKKYGGICFWCYHKWTNGDRAGLELITEWR